MKDLQSLADELLKQEGLARNEGSKVLLEQMRRAVAKAEQRERFWFRTACAFWIVAGICFLVVAILGSVEHSVSMTLTSSPPGAAGGKNISAESSSGVVMMESNHFDPVRSSAFAAFTILLVSVLGGVWSSVWLMFSRRQAGQATMQMTLVALTSEIRDLKEQRAEEPGKAV